MSVGKKIHTQKQNPKVMFVTHFCPHYRVKTFEMLARIYDMQYLFYSPGNEWYGQGITGIWSGHFKHKYLRGFQLSPRTRVAPSLVTQLWRGHYDCVIKCVNGKFALPVTYMVARLRRKPFVLWTGIWMTLQTPIHRMAFPITRWIYRHADAVAVYGEHVKKYLVQQGVKSERIFIAAHAIENADYNKQVPEQKQLALRAELSVQRSKVVLYLGRLEEIKGLDYLIKAFALLRSDAVKLILAGDGSIRKDLEALAKEQGVGEKVHFTGYVSPDNASVYYSIADVFVLPSVTLPTGKETWGLVVNEAMNQGLPVVATEAVGAAAGGLVRSGVTGFVVPERDCTALAEALDRLLTNDVLRTEMRRNALQSIAAWNNERMVKAFQQAIDYARQRGTSFSNIRRTGEKALI